MCMCVLKVCVYVKVVVDELRKHQEESERVFFGIEMNEWKVQEAGIDGNRQDLKREMPIHIVISN